MADNMDLKETTSEQKARMRHEDKRNNFGFNYSLSPKLFRKIVADTKSEFHQPLTSEENMSTEETSVPQGDVEQDENVIHPTPVENVEITEDDDEDYETGEDIEDEWVDEDEEDIDA